MKALPAYPSLYQVNTRVWQTGLAGQQMSRSNPEWRKNSRTVPQTHD